MLAFKLFRLRKDGSISSLFINKTVKLPIGEWLKAQNLPTKGFQQRKGWHCTPKPIAPHLSIKGRAWFVVEIKEVKTINRPKSQGGTWFLANQLKIIGPYLGKSVNFQKKGS